MRFFSTRFTKSSIAEKQKDKPAGGSNKTRKKMNRNRKKGTIRRKKGIVITKKNKFENYFIFRFLF